MKIMIIAGNMEHGGAARVAAMVANGLASKGHNVMVLANTNKPVIYPLIDSVKLYNFVPQKRVKFIRILNEIYIIRNLMKENKPDVVLGIMWVLSFLGWLASIGLKIPMIATEHNAFERPSYVKMSIYDRIAKFHLNKLYAAVTVLTNADKRIIGNRLKMVEVMPNPLFLKPCTEETKKEKIIMACGRLDSWHYKGFDLLIQAWGKISNRYPDWRVQIVGDGNKKSFEYLKKICKENEVESSVEFAGQHTNIVPFYQKAEIFVLSSRYEGFGLVLIEAMSQGCGCVACDYNGRQSDILTDKEEGLLCKCNDVPSLAETLSNMIDDDDARKKYQRNAIARSAYFEQNNIAERWEEFINKVVNNNKQI